MWNRRLFILLLASAPVFGQLESHTVAISATRSINLQPDEAVLGLSVNSNSIASLDQILAALSGLSVTSANLTNVNNFAPPVVQWNFTLAVPLSNLTATIGSLTNLQQTIAQNNSGLTLTFSVDGTQMSQQLQQAQACSNSDLVSDATAQAQKLTAATGMTLGPILRLSNTPSVQPSSVLIIADGTFGELLQSLPAPRITCSLLVEFQLLP